MDPFRDFDERKADFDRRFERTSKRIAVMQWVVLGLVVLVVLAILGAGLWALINYA